jgi:hypothetical protein
VVADLTNPSRLPDEPKETAAGSLGRRLAWFGGHGVVVERIMTDNGNCHRSQVFRQGCASRGLRHLRTWPYTNGPSDELVRVALCPAHVSSRRRRAALTI